MDAFKLNIDGKDILLYRCTYAPVKSNMFIIIRGKDAIVIDPNDNPEGLKLLKDRGVEVIHILLTHEHFDHTVGVPVLQQAFPQMICSVRKRQRNTYQVRGETIQCL